MIGGGAVVPGQQDGGQAQGSELRDRGGAGRLHRVGDHQHTLHVPIPGDDHRSFTGLLGCSLGCGQGVVEMEGPVG